MHKSVKLENQFTMLDNDFKKMQGQMMETFAMREEDFISKLIKLDKRILT